LQSSNSADSLHYKPASERALSEQQLIWVSMQLQLPSVLLTLQDSTGELDFAFT
jgi:hypothetical protein